jgi:hypothetical protein
MMRLSYSRYSIIAHMLMTLLIDGGFFPWLIVLSQHEFEFTDSVNRAM